MENKNLVEAIKESLNPGRYPYLASVKTPGIKEEPYIEDVTPILKGSCQVGDFLRNYICIWKPKNQKEYDLMVSIHKELERSLEPNVFLIISAYTIGSDGSKEYRFFKNKDGGISRFIDENEDVRKYFQRKKFEGNLYNCLKLEISTET